mmetsp:Transcript_45809/g.108090  ORF Transcript_45809/g.108090 Transcript_45809/m.108090 type:complete len:177 (+) Transcript_45809:3-533(+)
MMGFTAQFPDDSPIERTATFPCTDAKTDQCSGWTNATGNVHIGRPLPHAVWRSNHGMHPNIMATQEPLFNDTMFRYDLMADIFSGLEAAGRLIDDQTAVDVVATLGTKGRNFLTCDQELSGDNVMSIAYLPGPRGQNNNATSLGSFYVAWESGASDTWRPAACSPYVRFDLEPWLA